MASWHHPWIVDFTWPIKEWVLVNMLTGERRVVAPLGTSGVNIELNRDLAFAEADRLNNAHRVAQLLER